MIYDRFIQSFFPGYFFLQCCWYWIFQNKWLSYTIDFALPIASIKLIIT
jgi:hypothetical protein